MAETTSGGPGWKSTEFILTMLANLIGIVGVIKGYLPEQYNGFIVIGLTVLNSIYTLARTLLKVKDVSAGQTTVTTTQPVTTVTSAAAPTIK